MFYDYTEILEADYFQTHRGIAEDLAMQILISVLKGDQNYHYENIAFVCDASGQILRLAPNFPPVLCFRITCQGTTTGSVNCKDPSKESLSSRTNTKIFQMKKNAD